MPGSSAYAIALAKPPSHCPACETRLMRAHPQCPGCKEPLTPARLKARADAAVDEHGLGFPEYDRRPEQGD